MMMEIVMVLLMGVMYVVIGIRIRVIGTGEE
jgi:hypothetical protein